jgi:hypothetical protein
MQRDEQRDLATHAMNPSSFAPLSPKGRLILGIHVDRPDNQDKWFVMVYDQILEIFDDHEAALQYAVEITRTTNAGGKDEESR